MHNANVFKAPVHQFQRNRLSFVFSSKYMAKTCHIDEGIFVIDFDVCNK